MTSICLNGRVPRAEELRAMALVNYGHFTTMQVRDRSVRGLDLHLQRLCGATRELFGADLDHVRVLNGLRTALDEEKGVDGTARVTVCALDFDFREPLRAVDIDVIVAIAPPADPQQEPQRLKSFTHERVLPHVKHVGTFGLFHFAREARRAGYDDALFVGHDGRVSEGSTWNVGFWDGQAVVWPLAPALRGTCGQLLRAGLEELGVAQASREISLAELAGFRAGFACNSRGAWALAGVDDAAWAPDDGLAGLLQRALASRPWQPL